MTADFSTLRRKDVAVSNKVRAVEAFMDAFPHDGITFEDVSLVPDYADFLPKDADITTRLTRRINLNIPFLSAAMDTVTESRMAIGMAMQGGIGIIHKNMDIARQCREVEIVKHHLNGLIRTPVTFQPDDTLRYVMEYKTSHGFNFSGFPVVDKEQNLVGILTAADIKFVRDHSVRVSEIMTRRVITAGPATTLEEAYAIMQREKVGKLPLVANGRLVGLYSFSDVHTLIENARPLFNRDERHRLRVGAAVGAMDHERVQALAEKNVDVVVIDTAHGHSRNVIEMCRWVKSHFPDLDVIAGNIATGEAALALRDAGADGIKVGIGPGSICTTRVVAGVGIPQISAIYRCAKALQGSIPLIADGGIRFSGDVPKAIAVGADTVMMGSILAGTEESPGEKTIHQGRQYVVYRGMGSLTAMKGFRGSRERYDQGDTPEADLIPQGIEGIVPFSGKLEKVLVQFCGGLRAACGYCGCRTIADLQQRGQLVRVSAAGVREAHPHDVKIIKEAPNYTVNLSRPDIG